VAADGSFAYDPPAGFEGTDSFSYIIIDDEGQTDPAAVSIAVSDMVWFVDNNAGSSSDLGTFNQPFTSIASLNNAQGAGTTNVKIGDSIFIYQGTGTYISGVVLQNGQVLLGQGVDLLQQLADLFIVPPTFSVLTTSPPSGSDKRPTLTTTTGDAITVGSGNTVRGMNIGNTGGTGISGTSVGSLAVDNFAIDGTGGGLDLANGTLAVLLDGLSAVSNSDEGIRLINVGGIFGIEAGGPITTTNAITTTNVAAVDIDGAPLALSLTLRSVSASGAANGILVRDTTGNFTVTGDGSTAESGGTVQNSSGDGIFLSNTQNITLQYMKIDNTGRHGIHGASVTNFSFTDGTVEDAGNANQEHAFNFLDNGGGGLSGTVLFQDTLIQRMAKHGIALENPSGTLNMTVDGVTFRDNVNTACGGFSCEGDGMLVRADTAASINLTVRNSTFDNIDNDGLDIGADPGGTVGLVVDGISGTNNSQGDNLIDIAADGGPGGDFELQLTDFTSDSFHRGTVIFMKVDGTSTFDAEIGVVDQTANSISGSAIGRGIDIFVDGDLQLENPSARVSVANTNISNTFREGIFASLEDAKDDIANLHLTLTNNTVGAPTGGSSEGIGVLSGDLSGTLCLNMTGNNSSGAQFFDDVLVVQDQSTIFQLQSFAGNGNSATDVENHIINNNGGVSSVLVVIGDGFSGATSCNTPSFSLTPFSAPVVAWDESDPKMVVAQSAGVVAETALLSAPRLANNFLAGTAEIWSLAVEEGAGGPVPLSGETATLSFGDLNPGQVVAITFDVTVDATTPPNVTQVCNQGLFTGDNFADELTDDPAVGGAFDPTCTSVAQADLEITKSDSADPVFTGDPFTYTLTVSNNGPSGAQDVEVTDTLPTGVTYGSDDCGAGPPAGSVLTWNVGSLANGASAVCNVSVTAPGTVGTITNSASVSATSHDPETSNNSVSEGTSVLNPPDLSIAKDDGGIEIAAGGTITYTLSYGNSGGLATSVVLTDTVPANTTFNAEASGGGWSCFDGAPAGSICTRAVGNVAGSSSGSVFFAVTVDDPVPALVTQITNSASVGDDGTNGPDRNPNDNSDGDSTPVDAAPDLTATKSADVDFAPPGSTIIYTIDYANVGDRISASTIISETVPMYTTWDANNSSFGWACSPMSGDAGSNCTINVGDLGETPGSTSFVVTVDLTLPAVVTQTTNYVDIYGISAEPDANPDDNSFSLTTALNQPPQLTILLDTPTIQYSDAISGTITAFDSGSDNLTIATSWSKTGCSPEVESTPGLPSGVTIAPTEPGEACDPASGGGVDCAWQLQGPMLESEGSIAIEVKVSDGGLETAKTMTIVVEPEEVMVEFAVNPIGVEVIEPGGFSKPFTLTVEIRELDLADPQARAGDIDNAVVSMVLVPVGPGSNVEPVAACNETITAGTVDPDSPFDYDILTVECAFTEVPVNTFSAMVVVDPNEGNCAHYLGFREDVVTVFDPSLGFTTGGGWFHWPGTEDPGSGYPGDRTHVGFNVKIEKKGKKGQNETVKGSLLAIRHLPDGSIVRLKSNAMEGLAVGEDGDVFGNTYGWASFNGKATFQAIGWPEPIGNHEFLAYVEDNDEPGAGADRFWVQVVKEGVVNDDLSLPEPATVHAETLEGGNIVVPHSPGGKGGGGGGGNRVKNLELVGRGSRLLSDATTDVWALGNYAYVGTFNFPCGDGTGQNGSGVRIWDVTDPTAPIEVDPIPSPVGSRANDVKVASMGSGDILVHSNERCAIGGPGGFEVWDVDDPENPVALAHVGPINEINPITDALFGGVTDVGVHNLWLFAQGNQDYVAVVAESVFDNFRIYDITDPTNPVFVSAWGAEEIFDPGVGEVFTDTGRVLNAANWLVDGFGASRNRFLHDVTVSADGNSAHLSNWDAGFVLLDISDPANPQLVSVALDPVNGSLDGEVNSHAGWPSEDGSIVVETEEDFSIFTITLSIDTGPSAGDYPAAEGLFTDSLVGSPMSGATVYVGLACPSDTVPPAGSGQIALIQRGSCDFDEKASQAIAAGYSGMVVFNHSAGGDALVSMAGDPRSIQGVFVGRSTGLAIAGVADESGLSVGALGETITATTVPDAWGGVRIWDYSDPTNPVLASNFFTECSADPVGPSCEEGRVYSVHNVVVETEDGQTRAFISWYADGVRVVNVTDPYNPDEESRFVESGSAFEAQNGGPQDVWGIYKQTGSDLIYASDRNGGLYILQLPMGKGNK
jgi:uncharacterized repeat protein (TIGR01451 family)